LGQNDVHLELELNDPDASKTHWIGIQREKGAGLIFLMLKSKTSGSAYAQPQSAYNTERILNTGQWLSIPFVLVGMGLIAEVWTDHTFGIFIKDKDANKKWG